MKLIVDELQDYKSDCPFCTSYYDENEEEWVYECTLTNLSKEECDLENSESCKGLTITKNGTIA